MHGCKLIDTPIEPNHKLGESKKDVVVDHGRYQHLEGNLIYLSHTHIRLDIAFAVSLVSQFIYSPREVHLLLTELCNI